MPLPQSTFSMSSSYSNISTATHQPAGLRRNSRNLPDALRGFALMLLLWLTIFGLIISIAWLILKPQAPDFRVNSLTVSNFELSGSQIRGKYDVEIFIRNPNKKLNLYLSNFKIVVLYRRTRLCENYTLASLSLEKMKQTTLSAQGQLQPSDLGNPVKAKELKDLVWKFNSGVSRVVNFDVKMSVSTTFIDGKWLQVKRSIDVYCKNLNIIFLSSKRTGKLEDKRQSCVVSSL